MQRGEASRLLDSHINPPTFLNAHCIWIAHSRWYGARPFPITFPNRDSRICPSWQEPVERLILTIAEPTPELFWPVLVVLTARINGTASVGDSHGYHQMCTSFLLVPGRRQEILQ